MIAVVDYGMGNLRSVQKALQRAGGDAVVTHEAADLARADKVVLPGVGAFPQAMDRLRSAGLAAPLLQAAREGKPFLGICLGFQLLFDVSFEGGECPGLGLFPGKVVRFEFPPGAAPLSLRVPHMGWNGLAWSRPCPLLQGVSSGAHVYFAHSYYVVPADPSIVCTTTDYGGAFTSSIWKDNVFATQFHPEKSQAVGLRMLENFVQL
jgi:imidazole glycerol-phosphate synthase subunit HisH